MSSWTYWKTTSSGNLSPGLRVVIVMVLRFGDSNDSVGKVVVGVEELGDSKRCCFGGVIR